MNLRSAATGRINNLDFIRFVAASLVIISHSFPLTGRNFEPYRWLTGYETLGSLAVSVFFVISGFLIVRSWDYQPALLPYIKKRALRIYPAYIVVLLFGVFVVGALNTTLSITSYLAHPETARYLLGLSFIVRPDHLPGVFIDNPISAINGSLWTLRYEIMMYGLVAAIGIIGGFRRRWLVLLPLIGFAVVYVLADGDKSLYIASVSPYQLGKLGLYFFAGAALYLWRAAVPLDAGIFCAALALYVASMRSSLFELTSFITLPYLVLYVGYLRAPRLAAFSRHGDFSYGIYVYAFPVQQMLMATTSLSLLVYMLVSLLGSLVLGMLSWYLIESPALKFKSSSSIKEWLFSR